MTTSRSDENMEPKGGPGGQGRPESDHNSPEELLAVVDENNREIGALPRRRVHAERLRHRAVHVLVCDGEGRYLLQERSAKKDLFPLHWECVGGHLGPGESYPEAAGREVREELGVAVAGLELVGKVAAAAENLFEFVEVYRGVIREPLRPDPEEVVATQWVTPEELRAEIGRKARRFSPIFLHTLRTVGMITEHDYQQATESGVGPERRQKIQMHLFLRGRGQEPVRYLVLHKSVERGSYWQPITGNAEPGEEPEACARRELREEVGIEKPGPFRELFCFEYEKGGKRFHETVFAAEAPGEQVRLSSEHDAYRWEPYEAARGLIHYESNKEALDRIQQQIAEGQL